jgi:hypothetical protein
MESSEINGPRIKWINGLKFLAGCAVLTGAVWFFSTGYTPPGIFGEVLRHNQANQIDASPFFYGDVENMTELEEGLMQLMEENGTQSAAEY